tara:strand:- start:856 stop:1026 length:171 start_codon:yes stop_codon:yes gene_type:complete
LKNSRRLEITFGIFVALYVVIPTREKIKPEDTFTRRKTLSSISVIIVVQDKPSIIF